MMRSFIMAMKFLRRDYRAGELRVLALAILIAVAAVTSVSFFTHRIHLALSQQANELLGADLNINSDHVIAEHYFSKAKELELRVAQAQAFPSMAVTANDNQLAMLKAVDEPFPLRGSVRIADALFATDRIATGGPAVGTVWVEPRLLQSMKLGVGDELGLGASVFKIAAVVTGEPGRGGNLFSLAPRVMMNLADLPLTQLVQPASRVQYTLLVAGDAKDVKLFKSYVEAQNELGIRVQDINDAQPEIRSALTRAQQFLGLAALTSVILTGVAVALAARRYAQRHLDQCAILRCVGATQKSVTQIYTTQILSLGVIASVLGVLLGFAAHILLIELLGAFAGVNLPPPSIIPALGGLATGMVTLVAFSLPPLLQLQNVPALRVLRRDLGALRAPGWFAYVIGIAVLAVLMVWQARDVKLGIYMTGGTLVAMILLALIAWGLLQSLRVVRGQAKGSWLFGVSNLLRRRNASLLQIVAFGLGIMALLMLTIVRGDLLDEWAKTLPDDAPNRFIINIQPPQASEVEAFFTSHGITKPELYPMVRGRLVQVNHTNTDATQFDGERAQRLIQRELNLTWTTQLPLGNKISDGKWWTDSDADKPWLSVEQGIAKTLGIKVGDKLTFKVGGDEFTADVVSLREVNWDSFRANFFVIGTPGVLKSFPSTYMTSFYLNENRVTLLNELVNRFPNITVIDIAAIMTQVRDIIDRVTLAVEYVFLFTLAAGVMVLFAGIQSTHDERMLENAIVRTLGGNRKQIVNALMSEFAILGILAGVLASILATVLSYVIANSVLNMPFYFNAWMWIYGVVGGGVGVAVAGYLGSRSVVNRPPLQTLRRVA